jgi:ankyrin repeat protein
MNEPAMSLLLDRGAEVDSLDAIGNTGLLIVCGRGNLSMVAKLMEHGADIGIKNKVGCTPLMKSSSNGRLVVVQKLVACKVDVNATDADGNTVSQLILKKMHACVDRSHINPAICSAGLASRRKLCIPTDL